MLLTSRSTFDSVFDLITVMGIFILTLLLAYFATKFVASYQKNRGFHKGNKVSNLEVIETYPVAQGKYIQIVKTGDKYIVIGVGKEEITMLTELTKDEIEFPPEEEAGSVNGSFKSFLDKARSKREKNT